MKKCVCMLLVLSFIFLSIINVNSYCFAKDIQDVNYSGDIASNNQKAELDSQYMLSQTGLSYNESKNDYTLIQQAGKNLDSNFDVAADVFATTISATYKESNNSDNNFIANISESIINDARSIGAYGDGEHHPITQNEINQLLKKYNISNTNRFRVFISEVSKFGVAKIPHKTKNGEALSVEDFKIYIDNSMHVYYGDIIDRKNYFMSTDKYYLTAIGSGCEISFTNPDDIANQHGYIEYIADMFNEGDEWDYVAIQVGVMLSIKNKQSLYIPGGKYLINKTIFAQNVLDKTMNDVDSDNLLGFKMYGAGLKTILKSTEQFPAVILSHCDHFTISDFTIEGNNYLSDGLVMYATSKGTIKDIYIEKCNIGHRAIYLCIYNTYINLKLMDNNYGYIGQRFICQTTFINVKAMTNKNLGMYFSGDAGNYPYNDTFINCCIEQNGALGYSRSEKVNQFLCGMQFIYCRNFIFENCYFEANGTASDDAIINSENPPAHLMFSDYIESNGHKMENTEFKFNGCYFSKPIYIAKFNSAKHIKFDGATVEIDTSYYKGKTKRASVPIILPKTLFADAPGSLTDSFIEVERIRVINGDPTMPTYISNYQGFKVKDCYPNNLLYVNSSNGRNFKADEVVKVDYIIKSIDDDNTKDITINVTDGSYDRLEISDINYKLILKGLSFSTCIFKRLTLNRCKDVRIEQITFKDTASQDGDIIGNIVDCNYVYLFKTVFDANNTSIIDYALVVQNNSNVYMREGAVKNAQVGIQSQYLSTIASHNNGGTNCTTGLVAKYAGTIIKIGSIQPNVEYAETSTKGVIN